MSHNLQMTKSKDVKVTDDKKETLTIVQDFPKKASHDLSSIVMV